jgi:mannitol/fructose-specific phosphotransferase system IIA component (Ntr-type)
LQADDPISLINTVSERLKDCDEVISYREMAKAAVMREREMPTGIEHGIALPHARTHAVRGLLLAFIRPPEPIPFQAPDGEPADLIFFSAIPPRSITEYLKLTARIVRMLSTEGLQESLRSAQTHADVCKVLGLDVE